jgi:H+-transporting ATPase
MAPLNDLENGNADKEVDRDPQQAVANNDDDQGEYGNLVRYISQYRDGRRASTIGGGDDDQPKKKHWWSRRAKGGDGDGFETPDDWLNTDIKQGLSSQEVETRRKKTGWNELVTEKENMFLKFLSYFTGPILYGKPPASRGKNSSAINLRL